MDAPAARAPVSGAWQLATGNWQLVGEFIEVESGKRSDRPPFVLRHGRENMHGQLIGVRVIDGDELHARVHQCGNERHIARQPVEFGDDQFGLAPLASGERGGEMARSRRLPRAGGSGS